MKLKNILLSIGLLFAIVGCQRKYDQPLLQEPKANGLQSNITIAELKKKYSHAKQNAPVLIESEYILRAIVCGNDESGNIYKTLYVQDKTGGIPIAVDQSSIFADYQVGQELFINLKGLSINVYGGVQQIGYVEKADPKKTRIAAELLKKITTLHEYPDPAKVVPIRTTIAGINDSMIGQVVELSDVAWKEVGQIFAVKEETSDRNLYDGSGQSLLVRNSGYSNFANDKIPDGIGTVIGILSKYNKNYQLLIRTKSDLRNFRPGKPTPNTPDSGNTGGSTGDNTPAQPSTPGAADKQSASATLLFPGADFEDEVAFKKATGNFGLKFSEVVAGTGVNGTKALHLTGKVPDNKYFFSVNGSKIPAGTEKTIKTISFYLKGKATGKSISINVYHPDGKFVGYNLGDVTVSKLIPKGKSTRDEQFVNDYKGKIDTGDKWVLITLDVAGVELNSSAETNIIAFKYGSNGEYNVYIDDIKFE